MALFLIFDLPLLWKILVIFASINLTISCVELLHFHTLFPDIKEHFIPLLYALLNSSFKFRAVA